MFGCSYHRFLGVVKVQLTISNNVLRFHGINERISKKNYEELIQFYFRLIQNCDTRQLPEPHSAVHEL